jgi:toxin ParE1/3/4
VKPPRFHPEAEAEYDEAIGRYADIDDDLGRKFQDRTEAVVGAVCQHPGRYALDEDSGCRQAVLKKFPYSLFYIEFDECVWIVAVAHHKRRPGYWIDRLKDLSLPA